MLDMDKHSSLPFRGINDNKKFQLFIFKRVHDIQQNDTTQNDIYRDAVLYLDVTVQLHVILHSKHVILLNVIWWNG